MLGAGKKENQKAYLRAVLLLGVEAAKLCNFKDKNLARFIKETVLGKSEEGYIKIVQQTKVEQMYIFG